MEPDGCMLHLDQVGDDTLYIYKRGEGVLARLVFRLPEKNCRTPTVYCVGKKHENI